MTVPGHEIGARLCARLTARVREQRGFALIEVMVSAALLTTLTVGVLAGLDAANSTSRANKSRATAASLAEDDQERMRGIPPTELLPTETRSQKVGKATYTITSTVNSASSTGTGCGEGDLFHVNSSVTWPNMRGLRPVKADSYVATSPGSIVDGEGGLIVEIRNRAAVGVSGMTVSVAGPKNTTDTTDVNGCAFFGYLPVGNYTVTFARAGWVNPAGQGPQSKIVSVPNGGVSTQAFDYDQAGQIRATVKTKIGTSLVDDDAQTLAAAHSLVPAPGFKLKNASPSPGNVISTGTILFPFTSPYSVFSGTCANANPKVYNQPVPSASIGPGGTVNVNVIEPNINLTVQKQTPPAAPVPLAGANVKFTNKTCGGTVLYNAATNASGQLPKPGLPYGDYDVCADDGTRRATVAGIQNRVEAGRAPFSLTITPTSTAGRCP